jgi:RNA recognition motif-containing protein
MNIYVSNLGYNFGDDQLNKLFSEYGTVSSARVIMDKATDQSRGFGFVEMPDDEAAGKAIKELNGVTADGRSIKVSEARPKEERSNNNRNSSNRW